MSPEQIQLGGFAACHHSALRLCFMFPRLYTINKKRHMQKHLRCVSVYVLFIVLFFAVNIQQNQLFVLMYWDTSVKLQRWRFCLLNCVNKRQQCSYKDVDGFLRYFAAVLPPFTFHYFECPLWEAPPSSFLQCIVGSQASLCMLSVFWCEYTKSSLRMSLKHFWSSIAELEYFATWRLTK